MNVLSTQSSWTDEYKYGEFLIGAGRTNNLLLGYKSSFDDKNNKRDAWTMRYDLVVGDHNSFSLKYIHQNWYWLEAGKESVGLAFNSSTKIGFFYTIGYYVRWLKQKWDPSPYSPFNFETDDEEGFPILVFGWKYLMKGKSYWTLDLNNVDNFSYYSADNWASDFKYFIPIKSYTLTFSAGIRWSGILALAPYPATGYLGTGISF